MSLTKSEIALIVIAVTLVLIFLFGMDITN